VQIIPVIDVKGGIVVHASGGDRTNYAPLQSVLTSSVEPIEVIRDLLTCHPFNTIYIADLDAIVQQRLNIDFYRELHQKFPDTEFWLDAGIRTRMDWQQLADINGIRCIIASESLIELDLISSSDARSEILSLDLQDGNFLGNDLLLALPEAWPEDVIVMNLDFVGEAMGPDFMLLNKMKGLAVNSRIVAAGGVRNEADLKSLTEQGLDAALIASALHKGAISSGVLRHFETGHHPL